MDIDEENTKATINLSDTQRTTSAPSPSKRKAKEWGYDKLYGKELRKLKDVSGTLFALFARYMDEFSHLLVSNPVNQTPTQIKVGDKLFEEFDNIYQDRSTSVEKTELHLYLEEKRLDRKQELDILSWWKLEQFRYPVLSCMAFDVLTIPISTVASESVFSISGRVLDQYRSSLLPETVQALLCTRDWLFGKEALEK
ncbi:zinc finger BED domain-containing protein DAYSLEEPER-like isoform X4 [Pyrus x bretschneideri]|uniref:zinc finger BED domain-containing protein DAYSLEEPER-like isoform X4 n=1 Tax=Pyrus x bretschneideri TaxID=225117 RepID=UPI0020310019|nr:zinc finger BED domain-containing protein DAYSLEEPER-like isoform X4 [Pyrus x bretschneideri]